MLKDPPGVSWSWPTVDAGTLVGESALCGKEDSVSALWQRRRGRWMCLVSVFSPLFDNHLAEHDPPWRTMIRPGGRRSALADDDPPLPIRPRQRPLAASGRMCQNEFSPDSCTGQKQTTNIGAGHRFPAHPILAVDLRADTQADTQADSPADPQRTPRGAQADPAEVMWASYSVGYAPLR